MAYLDDLIGAAETEEVLLQKLELVLDRFRKAKLKLTPREILLWSHTSQIS
jgi:hypothetical protein